MRLPITNICDRPLTVFVEAMCNQYEVPPGGMAIVRIEDGMLNSIDLDDAWITIWDDSCEATVEVVPKEDMRVDDALRLSTTWLHRMGAEREADLLQKTVDDLEGAAGYFRSRRQVFAAFHDGLTNGEQPESGRPIPQAGKLAACYRAGMRAAHLNMKARKDHSFPELGGPAPLDTDTVQSAFARALAD